jgi:hypothetical protein
MIGCDRLIMVAGCAAGCHRELLFDSFLLPYQDNDLQWNLDTVGGYLTKTLSIRNMPNPYSWISNKNLKETNY